ncbi:chemotaxis protein CheW [Spirulina major CS-329]|uniref:chemotaxis protein CheW n=1 Tax=Spirulina TaxID=1154 RepID=UPI00232B8990|nr:MULTISPECIES: chemotaxis protein CheW [Spirulina]MDB9493277.1 chemotaxis protein CheW [Spirulina subsalsa CS-330]MDB9504283.1 chemotaxis protein CheW [Spirulina major CS-329]
MPESLTTSDILITGQTTYLIFTLDQTFYGVDSLFVEEIFFLPELTPVPESPRYIIGVLNLRGEVIPVMDVNLRLGYQTQPYSIHDRIVVLQSQDHRFGILVNEVHNVRSLHDSDITAQVRYRWEQEQAPIQTGLAHSGDEIIVLLSLETLLHPPERAHHSIQDLFALTAEGVDHLRQSLGDLESQLQTQRHFCATASPEDRKIFRDRAEHLRHPPDNQDNQGMASLAVVRLGPELFGIDLAHVREFTDIGRITPIPCCPPHIVGNVNLRGEIVTLIDITSFLALPAIATTGQRQAMIVDCDGLVVGVVVTEILDVVLLNPKKISPVPTAIHGITDEYLQGETDYHDAMMSILSLPKLLHQGQLMVDDSIL